MLTCSTWCFSDRASKCRRRFSEAGWHNSDPVSRHSFEHNLYALLNNSGYAQQPMTTFLLDGKPEDMNWQKGLNSYGRRDHLRIWQWTGGRGKLIGLGEFLDARYQRDAFGEVPRLRPPHFAQYRR